MGPHQVTNPNQTPNTVKLNLGVRLREKSSEVERERAQTIS